MNEEIKAIGEVAKTTGKAIDMTREFGGFISNFIYGSLEEGIGIFEDKLKYMRWERQLRLMKKSEEFMKEIELEKPLKPIPIKYAIPLFQAATIEDNDYLQDLWAKLLVNSSNKDSGIELCRTYIDILERLSPLEAEILVKIYSLPFEDMKHTGVCTINLPKEVTISSDKQLEVSKSDFANERVLFALANLSRLGCISPQKSIGGGEFFTVVNPTVLGKYLVESVTLNNNIKLNPNDLNKK